MMSPLFLAHGSPMLIFDRSEYTEFLNQLGRKWKPEAIVVFSAHWENETLTITSTDEVNETVYDYYGFPPEFYTVKYPAKGSSSVASLLESRFKSHGIAVRKSTRGLDHGSWPMLMHMYPKADIPVIQISIHPFLPLESQFKIGEALRGLEEDGILIIGSGHVIHNFRAVAREKYAPVPAWAVEFNEWLKEKTQKRDISSLLRYEELAPHARLAVPRPEHYVPLYIAMGSGNPQSEIKVIFEGFEHGTLSYLCFQF